LISGSRSSPSNFPNLPSPEFMNIDSDIVHDITGQRFGRLAVKQFAGRSRHRKALWECLCDCGNVTIVVGSDLRNGRTNSCRCLHKELLKKRATTHGETRSPEYIIWNLMRQRCMNPNATNSHRYIGRGITICERWSKFENFLQDMGRRPSPELTLDRINNDGNYEPGNCRWGTEEQQHNNTSKSKFLSFNGETLTIAQWARKLGIKYMTLYTRIISLGWTAEMALSTPVETRG
jgi:hypothetical protein